MIRLLDLVPSWVYAAAVAAALALAGYLGWQLIDAKSDLIASGALLTQAKDAKHALELAVSDANTAAERQAKEFQLQVTKAQNEAREREANLRRDAADARTESDGLHNDVAGLRAALDGSTRASAVDRAVAVGAVLAQCAARYQVLAERSDRHVNDLRTLIEAWPRAAAP